jgi:DNA-binding MarR family transcriptional regulator
MTEIRERPVAPRRPRPAPRGYAERAARDAPRTVTRKALLVGESDQAFRHLVHGMLAFSERLMAIRQGFGQVLGLTGIEYTVLVSIAHLLERGPVGVNSIAAHLHLSGAFVTIVTNQLAKKGLIRKGRDAADRRRAALTTTPKGQQLLAELAPLQQQVNDALFEPLSRDQFRALAQLVDPLVDAADRALALLEYLHPVDRS